MSIMNPNTFVIPTSVGDLEVTIFGSGRAAVRAAGPDERIVVGKFAYRVTIYFAAGRDGEWISDTEPSAVPSVYHTDGRKYFNPAAPTIKAKVHAAAKQAVIQAVKDNPMAMAWADVELAKYNLDHADRKLDEAQKQLEVAQKARNEAEKKWYDAIDRETAVQLAVQAQHA